MTGARSTAVGGCGVDFAALDNVPLERVAPTLRAILALPRLEQFSGGWRTRCGGCKLDDSGNYSTRGAPCQRAEIWGKEIASYRAANRATSP